MGKEVLIGRIFLLACIIISLLNVVKPEFFARLTYRIYKKYWNLTEDSLPRLMKIGKYWNVFMLIIFIYVFITLDKYFPQ